MKKVIKQGIILRKITVDNEQCSWQESSRRNVFHYINNGRPSTPVFDFLLMNNFSHPVILDKGMMISKKMNDEEYSNFLGDANEIKPIANVFVDADGKNKKRIVFKNPIFIPAKSPFRFHVTVSDNISPTAKFDFTLINKVLLFKFNINNKVYSMPEVKMIYYRKTKVIYLA